ncbi:hypothetical protein CPAR01_09686 [Colletotrichum paranaense]|uniref:AT hook domain-containing protein n=1 Tax=Colletotrichum paranaense TaxID=1914294 RepID=A0ABQ9SIP4_9PEZI|nr:uncharacterized protein CPAR01_09686 [Colletotrichum paranaense]KAK1536144.1 hypothetical protein CPAR01_09686 [Colletotrichum paranaense]
MPMPMLLLSHPIDLRLPPFLIGLSYNDGALFLMVDINDSTSELSHYGPLMNHQKSIPSARAWTMLDCDRVFRDCNCISPCSPPPPILKSEPTQAHQAAEDVFRKPISRSVESLRRQQRIIVHTERASRARLPSGKVTSSRTTVASARRASQLVPIIVSQERELERLRSIVASDALQLLTPTSRRHNRPSMQRTPPAWYIAMDPAVQAGPRSPRPRGSSFRYQRAVPNRASKPRPVRRRPVAGPSGSPSQPKAPNFGNSPSRIRGHPLSAMADPGHTFQHRESVASHERRFGVADPQLKAAGELPVSTPTPESVASLHTVTALLPYEEQFQAVGLAVTSEQQRQKSPPKPSPKKDMKTKNPSDIEAEPISTRSRDTRKQAEPGHLQLNGLRSASTSSSDSSTSGTQVAFAQPDAWELAFIDEVPAKKESSTSRCCNLPCFQNTRDESIDMPTGRLPPAPTPTTVDTPNKILAKWEPVYPQKTEALQGWREKASRDVRAKTWHGNTAQRPSTYRPLREAPPSRNETEAPSPKSKSPRKAVPHDLDDDKPPIPPRAQARIDRPRKQSKALKLESSAPKGIRKESQQNVFSDQENFPPGDKALPVIAKRPVKATVLSESDENTVEVQAQEPYNTNISTGSKQSAGVVDKPLRVSIRQPERKAKEKAALLNKPTQTDFEHPPIFQSGRMFRSLPGPATEVERRERSAQTSRGTITPNPALPSTWKLTLSSSSSLEVAMEAASREMKMQEARRSRHETLRGQDLETQAIPYMAAEAEHDEPLPEPVDEEAPLPSAEQPEEGREPLRGSDNSDPKEQDDKEIDDRDVLRGLHIAISAACNEEVDAWIRQKTGVRIRRFLADLKAFETLGEEAQPDPAKERARNRRADSRKLKAQIRQSKAAREARAAAQ